MICPVCTLWFCTSSECGQSVSKKEARSTYYYEVEKDKRVPRTPTDEQIKRDLMEILLKLGEKHDYLNT